MVGDSIRRVRLAEDQAEDIVEEAAEQVERLRSDTLNDYSLRVMRATQKAREAADELRAQVLSEADGEIQSIHKSAKLEREILAIESSKKIDAAVATVLEMLQKEWSH